MKRHLKLISVFLTALMLASLTALPVSAYKVGDKVSTYAYTDIVTYINNTPIESFNINWETAVIVEDLEYYGFNVVWDPTPGNRNLKVTRNYNKAFSATFKPTASTHKNGDYAGDVLFTDIVTYFEGTKVDSFNINGRTIVYVNDIAKFYAQPGTYKYDDPSRTLSLTLKGSASSTPAPAPTPTPSTSSPLKITTQPASVTAKVDASVSFNVAVSGGKAPYTYKWEMKKLADTTWSDAGCSTAIYSFKATKSLLDAGFMFRCVITDSDGNKIESNAAQLLPEAVTPLTIVTQPLSQKATTLLSTLTFTVAAAGGTPAYSYKWEMSKDGISWFETGSNTAQLYAVTVTAEMLISTTYVRCTVSDSKGQAVVSSPAVITGSGPVMSATLPAVYTATEGVAFSGIIVPSITNGSGSYKYEWYWKRGSMSSFELDTIDTDSDYDFPASALIGGDTWQIYCVVTDLKTGQTAKTNTCTLTVQAAAAAPLIITSQPSNVTVNVGADVTVSVSVTGGKAPYTYQWYKIKPGGGLITLENDSYYSGVNSATMTSSDSTMSADNGAQYYCVITDADGKTVTSNMATVTVTPPAALSVSIPSTRTTTVKKEVTFPTTVTNGSGNYSYEWWYKRGSGSWTKSGWTGSEYFLGSTLTEPATWYVYCVVTDTSTGKTATSNTCTITVS